MGFECALSATRGDRAYQEDSAIFWPGPATFAHDLRLPAPEDHVVLAILADGMGGHAGGATASETACHAFLAAMAGLIDLTPFRTERTCPIEGGPGCDDDDERHETTLTRPPSVPATDDDLTAALAVANALIGDKAESDPNLAGMGTTLVGASFTDEALEWVSVGDSPLYLYRDGEIALLNEDHSLAPALDQLARDGHITREAALTDPRRHMLRSALTGEPLDLVDRSRRPLSLAPDDIVILASDGIQTLETSALTSLVTASRDGGADRIADAIVKAVERMGIPHQDNTTVMVIRKTA